MAAQNYGTIGTVPDGDYKPDKQYKVGNIVTYTNGSSYLAHTLPPIGTLPTNKDYWQVSAQGGGYASLDAPGVVQPDGDTIDINSGAIVSVKKATQNTPGIVKGSNDINVESDSSIGINTDFTQAAEIANIIANEAWSIMLGKISKSIAMIMGLDENALLKSMISNQFENVTTKVASAALVNNLKLSLDTLNSNLTVLSDSFKLEGQAIKFIAGFDGANSRPYLRIYISASKFYQLTISNTNIAYVLSDNGNVTTLWTKMIILSIGLSIRRYHFLSKIIHYL